MKILHISTYDSGGAGIAAVRLHQGLLKVNIKSQLLCLYKSTSGVPEVSHFTLPVRKVTFVNSLFDFFFMSKSNLEVNLKKIAGKGGNYEAFSFPDTDYPIHEHPLVKEADIIHLHWVSNFIDFSSFFKEVKKPIVWTLHDLNPVLGGFHYENDIQRNPAFLEVEKALRNYKHSILAKKNIRFIGNSKWTTRKFYHYFRFNYSKCETIYCYLNTSAFKPSNKRIAKEALGIISDKVVIGIGADNVKNYRKGYKYFLKAISMLNKTEKDNICIVSFSKGHFKDSEVKNLPEVIKFHSVSDTRFHSLIYSAMDFFVLPSIEEAFGQTGIEALCCDTPLLASRTGGIVEYLKENVNGLFFESGSHEDLYFKLMLLLNDPVLRSNLAYNCRKSALAFFEENSPLQKHIALYKEQYASVKV